MISKAKILLCYNEPKSMYSNYIGKELISEEIIDSSESDHAAHVSEIIGHLQKYYSDVDVAVFNTNIESVINKILNYTPDVIFNLVETVDGISNYEAYAAGLYELLQIKYTGNTPLCLGTCLDKSKTKQFLHSFGIKTPNFYIATNNSKIDADVFQLRFPVILKLLREDASIGISEFSVCRDLNEINARLQFLFNTYKQDVLIEEYINGREFNVAILGDRVLPISEIDFTGLPDNYPKIVTYEGKWLQDSIYYQYTNPVCPANLDQKIIQKIESVALKCYKLLYCRDYARVDVRLDNENTPYVIEVNPNPDISSDAGFARAAAAAGISYSELLKTITNFALNRKSHDTKVKV